MKAGFDSTDENSFCMVFGVLAHPILLVCNYLLGLLEVVCSYFVLF